MKLNLDDVRTVNDILAKYHFSINYINKDGDTLLNFAVAQGKILLTFVEKVKKK